MPIPLERASGRACIAEQCIGRARARRRGRRRGRERGRLAAVLRELDRFEMHSTHSTPPRSCYAWTADLATEQGPHVLWAASIAAEQC